jgi:4'-phosphopantetheinyl transferase
VLTFKQQALPSMFDHLWSSPSNNLALLDDFGLSDDEVHVWRATLDWPLPHVQMLQQLLAQDERQKADRFYFARDRLHYIVARGLLRTLLGHYLKLPPDQLHFDYNAYGKPALVTGSAQAPLSFNLSHSGGLVLYAFARNRALGIDVECVRPIRDYEQMAEQVFSPYEQSILRALPADKKIEAFFNGWTRKEAYIKARGQGLSLPLDQFDVTLAPGEPARLLHTRGDPQEAQRWSLQELSVDPDYKAALAVEGHGWRLCCWQWPTEA